MSTEIERKINDAKVNYLIKLCANGNLSAERYLLLVANAARILDDLVDKDYEVSNESIYKLFFMLFVELPADPFYLQYRPLLAGVHILVFNAWIDANAWEKEKGRKKQYAEVIKDYVNELLPLVAYINGGYEFMRKVSLVVRETFLGKES